MSTKSNTNIPLSKRLQQLQGTREHFEFTSTKYLKEWYQTRQQLEQVTY